MDMETDYGVRLTGSPASNCSGSTGCGFVSIVDYVGFTSTDDSATDSFEAEVQPDGTPASGSESGGAYAYQDAADLTSVSNTGFEFSIPYSFLGSSSSDEYRLFAFYGDVEGDNISATIIPDDGTTAQYSNSEDWTAVAGTQATGSQVLPVELTSFDVAVDGTVAQLEWTTATETNNSGFAIQHAAPGQDFQRVGWRDGAGTASEAQTYRFRVEGLAPGTHRFRLKQVDVDGTTALSDVVDARVGLASQAVMTDVAPNPVRGRATLAVGVQDAQSVTVDLYNLLGQKVRTLHRGTLSSGRMEQIDVRTNGLSSGVYIVRMQGESFTKTKRLTVVR